jgi:hypothetical protein
MQNALESVVMSPLFKWFRGFLPYRRPIKALNSNRTMNGLLIKNRLFWRTSTPGEVAKMASR